MLPSEQYIGKSIYGPYGDFVNQVDDIVGQIKKVLAQTGQAENTLLIFTSDNGSRFEPKLGHSPNGDLRGKKGGIFEGGHRVPFLASWPGKIKKGSINSQLVGINDIIATVATIVGHKLHNDTAEDSISILPTLLDASKSVRQDLIHHSVTGVFAIRDGDWKLIVDDTKKKINYQLYNLDSDPAERNDMYSKEPEVGKRLADKLKQYRQSGRSVKASRAIAK